ncbi:MAG: FKBP-type peptidyl-prolyl cis-trans isomerase [Aeromicrobium sp.]
MRRILLATVAASLFLAGCGGSDSEGLDSKAATGDLSDVTVSSADTPKVTVEKGFAVAKTETEVVKEGAGDVIAEGDAVKLNYVGVNGRTGKQFDSSFTEAKPLTVTLSSSTILPGFIKGLSTQKVGSRILVAISPEDGFGQAQEDFEVEADDTLVFLFDIVAKVPTEVTGTAEKLPSSLPEITLDADNHPSGFAPTKTSKPTQTKASAHVVIQGDGAEITAGQTLTAQYVGQVYPDGQVFDESWSTGPRPFTVGTGSLIKCWDDLLVGQKLGTRVVLVCPADTAYGDNPQEGGIVKAGDTLMFAIDLLDAS